MHLIGFIIRIYHDALYSERQINSTTVSFHIPSNSSLSIILSSDTAQSEPLNASLHAAGISTKNVFSGFQYLCLLVVLGGYLALFLCLVHLAMFLICSRRFFSGAFSYVTKSLLKLPLPYRPAVPTKKPGNCQQVLMKSNIEKLSTCSNFD